MKHLVLLCVLSFISGSVYATKARLQALGEDKNGSYYIADDRDIFLNSSTVNNFENLAVLEWGSDKASPNTYNNDANSPYDLEGKAKPMGGFLAKMGGFVAGIFLGNESDTATLLRNSVGGTENMVQDDRKLDLFFGADMGIKWGVNLAYSSQDLVDGGNAYKGNSLATRLGVTDEMWGFLANVSIKNEAERDFTPAGGAQFDGGLGLQLGGNVNLMDYTFYAEWEKNKWDGDVNGSAVAGTVEGSYNGLELGVGRQAEITDKITLFTRLFYTSTKLELDNSLTTGLTDDPEAKVYSVPLVIALEAKAFYWLTLRGSIQQHLFGRSKVNNVTSNEGILYSSTTGTAIEGTFGVDGKRNVLNSTVARVGATIHFGDLHLDGLLGVSGNDTSSTFNTDNLLARAAFRYNF